MPKVLLLNTTTTQTAAKAKGNSAMVGGALSGLAGVGMGAFNLFSGKKGTDDATSPTNSFSGNWGDMSNFLSDSGVSYTQDLGGYNPFGG